MSLNVLVKMWGTSYDYEIWIFIRDIKTLRTAEMKFVIRSAGHFIRLHKKRRYLRRT